MTEPAKLFGSETVIKNVSQSRRDELKLKALRKLWIDRKTIEERLKAKSNGKEINEENQDQDVSVHPLELIHEKSVWEQILGHLDNEQDIVNASHVCEFFRGILEKKKINVLLDDVITIMQYQYQLEHTEPVDKKAILNLRRMSKSWKASVDKVFFESKYLYHGWFLEWFAYFIKDPIQTKESIDKIISALEENPLSATGQACLFTREITIRDPFFIDQIALFEFYAAVAKLFKMCGHSIWALEYQTRRPFHVVYETVSDWATLLPELKVLKVVNMRGFNEDDAYIDDDMRREFNVLMISMLETDFPFIPSLCHYEAHDLPAAFSSKVLYVNRNVKSVAISEVNWELNRVLEDLRIERFSVFKFQYPLTMHVVFGSGFNNWPLKRIFLKYSSGNLSCNCKLVFGLLHKFQSTLLNVEVNVNLDHDGDKNYLVLPHVKRLAWRLGRNFHSIDFIGPLKSLQELQIAYGDEDIFNEKSSEEVIKFKGIMDHYYESNIWQLFPSLKRVTFEHLDGTDRFIYDRK